jgi:hypothetical protein
MTHLFLAEQKEDNKMYIWSLAGEKSQCLLIHRDFYAYLIRFHQLLVPLLIPFLLIVTQCHRTGRLNKKRFIWPHGPRSRSGGGLLVGRVLWHFRMSCGNAQAAYAMCNLCSLSSYRAISHGSSTMMHLSNSHQPPEAPPLNTIVNKSSTLFFLYSGDWMPTWFSEGTNHNHILQ